MKRTKKYIRMMYAESMKYIKAEKGHVIRKLGDNLVNNGAGEFDIDSCKTDLERLDIQYQLNRAKKEVLEMIFEGNDIEELNVDDDIFFMGSVNNMTTHELNHDQMTELKGNYLCETQGNVSWGELADADEIVSDQTIHEHYAGTYFVDDDFTCSCN